MKSRVFASPQMHQSTARIRLFNDLIRFDQISDERDVAAAAKYRSVWELRIASRANHDGGKFTTARNSNHSHRRRSFHNLAHDLPRPSFILGHHKHSLELVPFQRHTIVDSVFL